MRQKTALTLSLVLVVMCLSITAPVVQAATVVNLPAMPIAQRFPYPDSNGDTGETDCMAAALTTALLVLSDSGNLTVSQDEITYASVRLLLRSWAPNLRSGIPPEVLSAAVPVITRGEFSLTKQTVTPGSWQQFLHTELAKSHPVIVHIADRNSLYNPASQTHVSHVIVVVGMDETTVSYTDSWDGSLHTIPQVTFANAWSKGYYNWLAFIFIPGQH